MQIVIFTSVCLFIAVIGFVSLKFSALSTG
jgi:hypothetical protein